MHIRFSTLLSIFFFSLILAAEEYRHDRWNIQPKDNFRIFTAFVSSFDGNDESNGDGKTDQSDCFGQPEWVAYEIRACRSVEKIKRPSRWTTDAELFKLGIAPNDNTYKHSGYDRGHLCMKHIASRLGEKADHETHTMVNACPQIHRFNAGIWLHLEKETIKWADQYGKAWVICGPVWEAHAEHRYIGDENEKKIPVPDKFYKIVAYEKAKELVIKSWLFPHKEIKKENGKYPLNNYMTSVDEVERLTKLDFFTALEDTLEDRLESAVPKQTDTPCSE